MSAPHSNLFAASIAAAIALLSPTVCARAAGIAAEGCDGCHGGGGTANVTVTASPPSFNPGELVTLTVEITSPTIRVGGMYVTTGAIGSLAPLSGEGLALNGLGLTHTAPKMAVGGQVTFRFSWQAPSAPGAVQIRVFAVAGNGDNRPTGDAPGSESFEWTFGCTGREYFWDGDGDGYGTRDFATMLGCIDAVPVGYAALDGDCNDNDAQVHPGAPEVCNLKDDNCDGSIDENAPAIMLWPDDDGDGYYGTQSGAPKLGCAGVPGYAALPGDCAPLDPMIHPGAKEVCNAKDDNCDGRIDEFVRPQCGTGWCVRESPTCNPRDCVPGAPHPETCNLIDDDCNGQVDDGPVCGADLVCRNGVCVFDDESGAPGTIGGSDGRGGDNAPTQSGGSAGPSRDAGPAGLGGEGRSSPSTGCSIVLPRGSIRSPAGWLIAWAALGGTLRRQAIRRGGRRSGERATGVGKVTIFEH